jgi:hypothetical protein
MQAARARVTRLRKQIADLQKAGGRESELARLRGELVEAERAIGEIEQEARAAGAPPGWLRE